jgi:hypothetical protein
MKRAIQLLACALATALTSQAQTAADSPHPSRPVQQAVHQLEVLEQRVPDLTPDQVISLNSILLEETIALDSLHEHPSGDPKTDGQFRRNVMHNADVQIYSLLNENQQVQYVTWKQEQRIKNLEKQRQKDQQQQAAADSTKPSPTSKPPLHP